jgi:hypothetical protein
MSGDRGRYSRESWERTAAEAKARPALPDGPQHAPPARSTLVPGVVEMSRRF